MNESWTEEVETELFNLLPQLAQNSSGSPLATQVPEAHKLVDRLLVARVQADQQELQDKGHPEKLTRI